MAAEILDKNWAFVPTKRLLAYAKKNVKISSGLVLEEWLLSVSDCS